jgi:hypothetical protein
LIHFDRPLSPNWFYDIGTGYGTGEKEHTTNSTDNVYLDGNGHLVLKAVSRDGSYSMWELQVFTIWLQAGSRYAYRQVIRRRCKLLSEQEGRPTCGKLWQLFANVFHQWLPE